jgi:antitoxin VapB
MGYPMALFIRNPEVHALAEEVRRLTNAKTKTEAVRRALEAPLAQARRAAPLEDRLARSKALADALGTSDPSFDMKAFTDEMWGKA